MKSLAVLVFCSFAAFAGPAIAQTADGQTPAEESVCDVLDGAAWGLCNAYCEAMDCDSTDPKANRTACDKVKGKFATLDQGDLPCEPVVCPCGTAADNIGLFTTGLMEPDEIRCEENEGPFDPSLAVVEGPDTFGIPRIVVLHGYPSATSIRCVTIDGDNNVLAEFNDLTEAEYDACRAEIESVANQLSLTCQIYND